MPDSTFVVKEYYKDGELSFQGICKYYFPLIKQGESVQYYTNNKIRSKEVHDNNKLISNQNWLKNGERTIDNVYEYAEVLPSFNGSIANFYKYLSENMNYPTSARKNNIQGKVYVEFIVSKTGTVEGVQVLSGVNSELDEESVRVVESSTNLWTPGQVSYQAANVKMCIPISFKLTKK